MRAGSFGVVFSLALVFPGVSAGQQLPPLPHGPAALSVPHPIPPISTSPGPPRDLYQQLTPPPVVPTISYTPGFVYGPYGLFGPSMYAGSGYTSSAATGSPMPEVAKIAQGGLRFESTPGSAQVYVDGMYVGVIDDFGMSGRQLDLDEGRHRVELRAPGYATLSFAVNIAAYHTTRYRGDLERLSPPIPAVSVTTPPLAPKPTYVIPNCYAGDRPPSRALPAGCDPAKLLVRKP